MSGPKVVRIVTREELLATCHDHLERVEAALAAWQRVGRRNGVIDDAACAAARAQADALRRHLDGGDLAALQKLAPALVSHLQADMDARLQALLEAEVAAQERLRSLAATAAAVRAACAARSIELPAALQEGLAAASPEAVAGALLCLQAATEPASLAREGAEPAPPRDAKHAQLGTAKHAQPEMAAAHPLLGKLSEGLDPVSSLEAWLAAQEGADPRLQAARKHAAAAQAVASLVRHLELLGGEAAPYARRLELLQGEADPERRALLLESLGVEVQGALVRQRTRARLEIEARGQAAVLELLAAGHLEAAQQQLAERAAQLQAARALQAVEPRRHLVLEGLQALGYQVHEGLAAAWARDGRVVVQGPELGSGVELAGRGERLQMRAVRVVDGTRDALPARQDEAIETRWCSDLGALRERLDAAGSTLAVERAQPIGQHPVKVVHSAARLEAELVDPLGFEEEQQHRLRWHDDPMG